MDRFDRVFILNQRLMSWVGLGHNQTYRKRLIRYYVMGFMSLYCVLSQLCQLRTLDGDLPSIVPTLQVFIIAICLTIVYSIAVVHYMTIRISFGKMRQDWKALENSAELQIMQKHAHLAKLFTFILALMFYLYIIIAISPSLLRIIQSSTEVRSDRDNYPILSCFDYFLDRGSYYYPVVIYQIVTYIVLLTLAVPCYSAYFLFIQHICARLSIIKFEINRQFISNDDDDELPETPVDLTQWVINIIQQLSRTTDVIIFCYRRFMNLLNTTYEKGYAMQMFLAFILLIIDFLCLFQIPVLLTYKDGRKDVLMFCIFIFSTLFPIYINCYIGQRLIDCSVDVYKEACLVPIHNLTLKTQKLLLTMLMISSKPLAISVGKVYVSSHEFFCGLLRSSLSFAMVLHSVQRI